MRLFAALAPPPCIRDEVETLVAPLRRDDRLRWSVREDWHITTAFYGEVDAAAARSLADELEHVAERTHVGALRLMNATEFNGKVLVLEVTGDTEGLSELASRCTSAGRAAGLDMQHRRYRPHLTVGRTSRSRDLSAHVTALIGSRTREWQPPELLLMQSRRGEAPHYECLHAWPLSGGVSAL